MTVTVKDVINELKTYQQDLPVFWGIDPLPCWVAKRNKTIRDFPVRMDQAHDKSYYIYFGDFNDINILRDECQTEKRMHRQYYSLWRHIYDILFRKWQ